MDDTPIIIASSTYVDPHSHVVNPLVVSPPPPPPPLPRWAHFILKDLPPSRRHSIGFGLVGQAISSDPKTFSQAHEHREWDDAMAVEYSYLMRNSTWELVPLPLRRKLV